MWETISFFKVSLLKKKSPFLKKWKVNNCYFLNLEPIKSLLLYNYFYTFVRTAHRIACINAGLPSTAGSIMLCSYVQIKNLCQAGSLLPHSDVLPSSCKWGLSSPQRQEELELHSTSIWNQTSLEVMAEGRRGTAFIKNLLGAGEGQVLGTQR